MKSNATTVDEYLATLPEWQKDHLIRFRDLVHATYPDVSESIKWGVPVFSINSKMVFTMAAFKEHTKYNFIQNGALLDDGDKLFNNGLESNKSRGIDLREGETIGSDALRKLIDQAIHKL